jgi:putative PIN family toxin of toxin-antitoxin system
VRLASLRKIESVTCREILQEFERKLQEKLGNSADRSRRIAGIVERFSRLVTIRNELRVVQADPDDDRILECALAGGASHIITGDKRHLLPLGVYEGISIVSPAEFLRLLREQQPG